MTNGVPVRIVRLSLLPIAFLAFCLLPIFSATSLAANPGFETEQIVLYQPSEVLEERMADPSKLSEYIKRLRDVCQKFFATASTPETLDIVVAVRPPKQSRVWFVSSTQPKADAKREGLRRELEKVKACDVKGGSIVFAIAGKVAGGDGKKRTDLPMPAEWQRAAKQKGSVVIPDGILDAIWGKR
jgi:hypothetical protein